MLPLYIQQEAGALGSRTPAFGVHRGLAVDSVTCAAVRKLHGSFPTLGVPSLGVPKIRIMVFRGGYRHSQFMDRKLPYMTLMCSPVGFE